MPPPLGGSSRGCQAAWSISHHNGYCSHLSPVRLPSPCGLSCGGTLPGRRPPAGLCTGLPVTSCLPGSGKSLPWSLMQPGRSRTSGFGVPLLPLACRVGWTAPVRPTDGVLVLSCPSAALRVCGVLDHLAPAHRCARWVCCVACAVSWATWLLFTGVSARCVALRVRCPGPLGSCSPVCPGVVSRPLAALCACACTVSWPTWHLFGGVRAVCSVRVPLVVVSLFLCP